ncbi:hypothetical protein MMYC01_205620 [Madurella mycetomatis]|uniref:Uncharacterized protein n=1 Tax=Madurella mycetomatis TaxID=100816 RepID=A0A175W6N7_9PEZI|nr:hypothetical protein MMYC01_205620 [Madurella mycetomatis]
MLASSMSLGVIKLRELLRMAGAEIAVAMVCLGIPTLRPLYLRARGMSTGYADTQPTLLSGQELPQFTMHGQKRPTDSSPPISHTERDVKPHIPNLVPDSGSLYTMIESRFSQEAVVNPIRPSSAHTRGRSDPDIVDDILGYYDDRICQSGSRNIMLLMLTQE